MSNAVVARTRAPVAFALTMFLSAALIFAVQPMFARMALPLLGGAPAVWNVALAFFQAALLAGYAYAHLLQRLRRLDVQLCVHVVAIVLAALTLPLAVTEALGPPPETGQAAWLLGVLAMSVGAPFAVLSATAPLLQAWFARTGRDDAHDPYYLYAASNAGSLLALLAYPLVIEPMLGARAQSEVRTIGYALAAAALIGCGLLARTAASPTPTQWSGADASPDSALGAGLGTGLAPHGKPPAATGSQPAVGQPAQTVSWRRRAIWVGLAAVPASLLVGVTQHITTDVAATPFLWTAPLALYLLTFILAFARLGETTRSVAASLQIIAILALAVVFSSLRDNWGLALALNLAALFGAALTCHAAVAQRRPDAAHLTEFYFWISLGGVIGGGFNALVAPLLFNGVYEYPLALALSLLATARRPRQDTQPDADVADPHSPAQRVRDIAPLIALALPVTVFWAAQHQGQALPDTAKLVLLGGAALVALSLKGRPIALAFGAGMIFLAAYMAKPVRVEHQERGFFGVVRVTQQDGYPQRLFLHGTTLHGAQTIAGPDRLRPLTYYAPETPIGQAFSRFAAAGGARAVAAVGLGVGSVACYGRPGQTWRFYEIDPLVVKIAKDPGYFTFLRDCAPQAQIILGDARLSLAREPDRAFDFMLLDAFSSDVVPTHLMTREAVRLFMSKLSDTGVLVFHISNKHLDLASALQRVGAAEGLAMRRQAWSPDDATTVRATSSDVMVLARSQAALAPLDADPRWRRVDAPPGRAWTDDYTNVIGALLEKRSFAPPAHHPS